MTSGTLSHAFLCSDRLRHAWALLFGVLALAFVSAAAQAKTFPTSSFTYYVSDYEYELARIAKGIDKPAADLQAELAAAELAGDDRLAAVAVEKLVSLAPKDKALWLKLAGHLAAAKPINDQDGYQLPFRLVGASLKAYELATAAPDEATALALAGRGFARREDWRPALLAYKESLRLVENAETRQTYEQMRIDHGFRITDYRVENDASPPRVCFELSDPLSRTVTDFAPYFTMDPGPLAAVSAEGSRLCVEGLKYGERYSVTVRKGLPSSVDEDLAKDYSYDFYVRDRSPALRFSGKGFVLPRTGQNGIPVMSVNSTSADLDLYRIGDRSLIDKALSSDFLAQISGYTAEDIDASQGVRVWHGKLETAAPLNEEVTIAFPVEEAIGKLEPGLYVLTAVPSANPPSNSWDNVATQWFVVSDLGLATLDGKDGLRVVIRSIATADVMSDVDVRLIARNNEVLAAARTDAAGAVLFEPGLARGTGGQAPALVVAMSAAGDYGFIDLTQPAFDLTDRGVAGRDTPGTIDAFVYAERGVYRRGETVHATVLLRDDTANAIAGLPVVLVVERPDGMEYSRTTIADQGAGGHSLDFAINPVAQGGTWRIRAYTDPQSPQVGETTFLVEDYVPDRIEFDLTAKSAAASVGDGAAFAVDGRYLFGAPAAGLDLEANIWVRAAAAPFPQWKGYSFGLTDERVDTVQSAAADLPQTDIDGHADMSLRLPALPTTTQPLEAEFSVRMREPGGRAVEQSATLPVRAERPLLGIKPNFAEGGVAEGEPSTFDVIAVDADGKPVAVTGAAWTIKRLTTDYQWFKVDSEWRYEAITRAAKIAGAPADIAADKPLTLSQTLSWGFYRIEIAAPGFSPASIDFSAGYYYGATANASTPDTLAVALDRTDARTGETVNVKIDSRFAGKAVLQILGDRLLTTATVDVPTGGTTVPVTVKEGWGTGAYVVATLYRPMDVEAKRMPARAVGVAWFGVDRAARELAVKLAAPNMIKPHQTLTVPVTIGGLAAGEEAYITVAAVDVGILNLTRYNPPAPENFYFDQKRLSAGLRDIYGSLIDGMQGARGKIRSGGDSSAAFTAPPPTQPPLSLFSGIVKVKSDGTAEVAFDIPGFNGTVRVMAVAWSAGKVGHGVADVIVRDPVVMSGTLPRFLAVGDSSRFRLDLVNTEAPAGDYTLGVSIDGPVAAAAGDLTRTVTLGAAGARIPVVVPISATAAGDASLTARLIGPGNVVIEQQFALHVVPANPQVTRRTTMELAARGGAITLSRDLTDEMLPGTTAVSLSVGPLPELDAAGLIRDLDRYPYGCSEQTVSRALPLLYLSDLEAGEGVLDADLKTRMQAAVARLVNRQGSNGAFGLWSANDSDSGLWLSSFVTDFLLRAREKGYDVPEDNLVLAIDYLRNSVGNSPDIEENAGQDMAYALYVLARAGKAPVGDLKYLTDTKIDDFGSPLARAQIGAALHILGDTERSATAFDSAVEALHESQEGDDRGYRNDYGSVLRDAAAMLALGTEARAEPQVIKAAISAIAGERGKSSYASTQEMSWMVLAARAIAADAKTIELAVDGVTETGALYKIFADGELDADYTVTNKSGRPLRAVVAVSGSPLVAEPAAANGLTVSRAYHALDGTPVDPATVAQNTRLVVVLQVSAADNNQQTGTFLLSDPLPAGFEIENPRLVDSAATSSLSWLQETTWATYTEFRDDRFVAAFSNSYAKMAYMVRAVAPGTYAHPGASVEDMYRPELNARTATSTVTVTEP